MTPAAFLASLLVRGVAVTTVDGKLRLTTTADVTLTDDERAYIREHKATLVALLGTHGGPAVTPCAGGTSFCPNGCADELLFAVDDLLRGNLPPLPATEPERAEQGAML